MDDDLNTAVALAAMFDLIRAANTALDSGELGGDLGGPIRAWFETINVRLGIVPDSAGGAGGDGSANDETAQNVEALIAARNEARGRRDFEGADEIRQELLDMGVVIEDTRDGTRWRFR